MIGITGTHRPETASARLTVALTDLDASLRDAHGRGLLADIARGARRRRCVTGAAERDREARRAATPPLAAAASVLARTANPGTGLAAPSSRPTAPSPG